MIARLESTAIFASIIVVCLGACDRSPTRPGAAPGAGAPNTSAPADNGKATDAAVRTASEAAGRAQALAVDVIVPDGASPNPCGESPEGMQCVPGGWFVRGVDHDPHYCEQPGQPRDGEPSTTPQQRVWVSTFHIDETEVTNAAYQACVKRGDCPEAGPRYADFDGPKQAITGVSWFDAKAFCEAHGKRLPTEAEFEKAARGPQGEASPFGDEPVDCEVAMVKSEEGRSCGVRRNGRTPATGRVMPVKSRPEGRYGLYDIVGNAEEWVADWWTPGWDDCGEACRGVDPRGPCDGAEDCAGHRYRSVRGGSWYWPAEHATGWHRRPHIPSNELFHHFGFRCAVSAPEIGSDREKAAE